MKTTIISSIFCASVLLVEAGSSHAHHKSLLAFRRHDSHKRHAAMASSAKMIKKKRTPSLQVRKTPGNGDFTTQPDSIAQGTYTAKQGCAIWHVAGEGEVCLGLIDKSSAGFNMAKFLEFNPSINQDCSNLEQGKAYCVDTVAGSTQTTTTSVASKVATEVIATPKVQLSVNTDKATPQADADEDEDCEDEEDDSAEDDEDCEEEEDDTKDTVISVKVKASTPKTSSPVVNEEPKTYEQKKEEPKTTSTYVAPSSTYVAPSSTYVAPSPSPSPEKQNNNNNNGGGDWQQSGQQATWYEQNGNPGSCGNYGKDSDYIVAVKSDIMGSQLCGKQVKLRNTKTGAEVTATVADTCPTCVGLGIDLSVGVFKALAPGGDLGLGVLTVDYSIL